jgi:hypothetical protein
VKSPTIEGVREVAAEILPRAGRAVHLVVGGAAAHQGVAQEERGPREAALLVPEGWKAPHGQRKARVDYAAALATHEA